MAAYKKTPQTGDLRGKDSNTDSTRGTPASAVVPSPVTRCVVLPSTPFDGQGDAKRVMLYRLNRLGVVMLSAREARKLEADPWKRLYRSGGGDGVCGVWFDVTNLDPLGWPVFIATLKEASR